MTMNKNDGGYYAIKGFLYQFDKSLIEIFNNPNYEVGIEKIEDINIQNYVIQVKHRETQKYSLSKIKKPVLQLFNLFKEDKSQRFCLHCYFKDRLPSEQKLKLTELDKILAEKKDNYLPYLKNDFISNFIISFSENYEKQFDELISRIKSEFSLSSKDKAYIYHSIFRSKLFDISIQQKADRRITRKELDSFIEETEQTIFYASYAKYLDTEKYEKLIKREFFTFKLANIDNFERLFVIHCNKDVELVDINKIVNTVSKKYFRVSKSPQPYLCFLNLSQEKMIELKRELIDQGIMFNDGTFFNGDKFRLDSIIEREIDNEDLKIKIVDYVYLKILTERIKFKEIFQFYLDIPHNIKTYKSHVKIQISSTNQILKILN